MARDYTRIWSVYEATILQNMDRAITDCGLWEWVATFEPEGEFVEHPNFRKISDKLLRGGENFGWCMRNMQLVAKLGWEKYCQEIVANRQFDRITEAFAKSSDPEKQKQAEAMTKFKEGKLSYAEMRELCG